MMVIVIVIVVAGFGVYSRYSNVSSLFLHFLVYLNSLTLVLIVSTTEPVLVGLLFIFIFFNPFPMMLRAVCFLRNLDGIILWVRMRFHLFGFIDVVADVAKDDGLQKSADCVLSDDSMFKSAFGFGFVLDESTCSWSDRNGKFTNYEMCLYDGSQP
jgi:hypothetical protein